MSFCRYLKFVVAGVSVFSICAVGVGEVKYIVVTGAGFTANEKRRVGPRGYIVELKKAS